MSWNDFFQLIIAVCNVLLVLISFQNRNDKKK